MYGRYVKGKVALQEHLQTIDQNSKANMRDVNRLVERIRPLFKESGYKRTATNNRIIQEYIIMIFETQGFRCTHWLETIGDEINGVWNNPGTEYRLWKTDRINYEVDHVTPLNSDGTNNLENIQFLSPNANRFVKNALTYELLLKRSDLSDRLKHRIRQVLKRRKELFESDGWKSFKRKIDAFEKSGVEFCDYEQPFSGCEEIPLINTKNLTNDNQPVIL